jgi:hypothetical protein
MPPVPRRIERSLFVDDLELPPRAWTERLTLLVSASNGLDERPAERPRFVPVPRQGLDLGRDRDRKLRVLHYLLSQLDGSLSSNDVEVVHALYADSLSPSHRGWNDLRPTLVARGNVLSEKNVFTIALPPDVNLRLLEPAARGESEAVIKRDLFGQVVGVRRPEGMIVPVSPGSTVVSALAADNNPPHVFLARLDGPLEDLEAWDAPPRHLQMRRVPGRESWQLSGAYSS